MHRRRHTFAHVFAYEPYVLHIARPRYTCVKTKNSTFLSLEADFW